MLKIVSKSVNWSRKSVSNPLQSVHSWKAGAPEGGSAPPTSSAHGVTAYSNRRSAYGSARSVAPGSGGRGMGDSQLAIEGRGKGNSHTIGGDCHTHTHTTYEG